LSVGEVLKWAFDIDQAVQPAVAAEAALVEIGRMEVAELKEELKARGLSHKGSKRPSRQEIKCARGTGGASKGQHTSEKKTGDGL
jgi:hypothetical protein